MPVKSYDYCRYLTVVYLIYSFAYTMTTVILSALQTKELNQFTQSYESIINNWSKDPVISLSVVTGSSDCPLDHPDNLVEYVWPGTAHGCQCYTTDAIVKDYCCINPKECNSCYGTDIKSQDTITFTQFGIGSPIQKYKICAKRLKNYSFFKKAPLSNKCDSNNKPCMTLNGNQEFMYCVPNNEQCPIRSIKITNSIQTDANYNEQVTFNVNGYYIMISRNFDAYPLSETYIGEGTQVCINPNVRQSPQGKSRYILLQDYANCSKLDTRWQVQTQIEEKPYFIINDQLSLTLKLPKYELSDTSKYSIFTRNYIQLKQNCREYIYLFKENQEILDSYSVAMIVVIVFSSIMLAYVFFFDLQFIVIINHKFADGKFYFYTLEMDQNTQCMQLSLQIGFVFKMCMLIAEGIALNICFEQSFNERFFIQDILSYSCLDPQTETLLKDLNNHFDTIAVDAMFGLWLVYVLIEPTIIYAFYSRCKCVHDWNKVLTQDDPKKQQNQFVKPQQQMNDNVNTSVLNQSNMPMQQPIPYQAQPVYQTNIIIQNQYPPPNNIPPYQNQNYNHY